MHANKSYRLESFLYTLLLNFCTVEIIALHYDGNKLNKENSGLTEEESIKLGIVSLLNCCIRPILANFIICYISFNKT